MRVLIDADGCPVVRITVQLCRARGVECLILCDTSHHICLEGAKTLVFDRGADSVDFALVNLVLPGDLVITQDYGLAAMCLGRQARVLHQDGKEYTPGNIDALLTFRHEAAKSRRSGKHLRGPKKRTPAQDTAYELALKEILEETHRNPPNT